MPEAETTKKRTRSSSATSRKAKEKKTKVTTPSKKKSSETKNKNQKNTPTKKKLSKNPKDETPKKNTKKVAKEKEREEENKTKKVVKEKEREEKKKKKTETASPSKTKKKDVKKKTTKKEEAEAAAPPKRSSKKETATATATKKDDGPTPKPDPKWELRREAMRELFDDIRTARDFSYKKGYMARFEKQDRAKKLWSTFLRETTHELRTMQVSPDVDLQTLMATVEKGEIAADPRENPLDTARGNCLRHCRYVGKANAEKCIRDPSSIVSICAPDPRADAGSVGCRFTLCFDAEELGRQIDEFHASGRKTMRNPAWNQPGLDRSQLRPELDADEVATLQWQVALAKERAGLHEAMIDAGDRHVLTGIVLPAMVRYLRETGPVDFMVRLFRGITPTVVQNLFTKAMNKTGNALLFLLDNTFLSSIAFIVTKAVRTLVCYAALGFEKDQLDILQNLILKTVDPERHHPILSAVVRVVITGSRCAVAGMTGAWAMCIGSSFRLLETSLPRAMWNWATNLTTGVFAYIGGPLTSIGDSIRRVSTVYGQEGLIAGAGYGFNAVWVSIFGNMMLTDKEVEANAIKDEESRLEGFTKDLYDDFSSFYVSFTYAVTAGILLWLARHVCMDEILRWLRVVARVNPAMTAAVATLETVSAAVRKANPGEFLSLHRCILFVLEFPGMLLNLGTVIETVTSLVSLLRCASVLLAGFVGRIVGIERFKGLDNNSNCCTKTLLDAWKKYDPEPFREFRMERDHGMPNLWGAPDSS